ncbi:MAG TPA: HU family DNA-binding protein [Thermoanaerobaculia bacterium]|nr:HU family DNA-binding protein [Thermoanaerobaculia bacterium]
MCHGEETRSGQALKGFPFVDTSLAHCYARRRFGVEMIKSDIVDRVAEITEVPRVKAAQAVDTIIEAMKNALCDGKRIELRGFGVFQVRDRKKGVGRNPKTGVEVAISPGKTVRFKPGKDLKNL